MNRTYRSFTAFMLKHVRRMFNSKHSRRNITQVSLISLASASAFYFALPSQKTEAKSKLMTVSMQPELTTEVPL